MSQQGRGSLISRQLEHGRLLHVAAVWVMVGVVLALCTRLLFDYLWVATLIILLPYPLAGAAFLLAALWGAWRERRNTTARRGFLAAASTLLISGVGLYLVTPQLLEAGSRALVRFRFNWHRREYELVVRDVSREVGERRSALIRRGVREGVKYEIDSGPPLRFAFLQPGGILDNWEGIVYDPTDVVQAAHGWRFDRGTQEFTAPPHVKELFGGDLVRCRRLDTSWYVCTFT